MKYLYIHETLIGVGEGGVDFAKLYKDYESGKRVFYMFILHDIIDHALSR